MLQSIKSKLGGQILLLAGYTAAAAIIAGIFGIRPAVRPASASILAVLAAGAGGLSVLALSAVVLLLCASDRWYRRFIAAVDAERRFPPMVAAGSAVVAGLGEEILLRGFLFAALLPLGTAAAFIANAAASFVVAADTGRNYAGGIVAAAAGTYFAFIYFETKSLFLCAAVRIAVEAAAHLLLRSERVRRFMGDEKSSVRGRFRQAAKSRCLRPLLRRRGAF